MRSQTNLEKVVRVTSGFFGAEAQRRTDDVIRYLLAKDNRHDRVRQTDKQTNERDPLLATGISHWFNAELANE